MNPTSLYRSLILLIIILLGHSITNAQTSVYTLNGGTDTQIDQTFAATLTDQSAVYVLNSGQLTLTNCTMTKTGDASNVNNSSQYGINAGVLAASSGDIIITGGSVTTNALGSNGLFATGSGTTILMTNGIINASGGNAHGVDVTYGGTITLTDVNITTNGNSSSALATDFGGGNVNVTGGTIISASTEPNSHSAGIYSTGNISVTNAAVTSLGDCGGVIDGANSISLTNTSLTGKVEGIKIWKTAPMTGTATVTVNGGSLTSTDGNAFYVTGETGNAATASLTVSDGAEISTGTGYIVNVIQNSSAAFTSGNETLTGNFIADESSTLIVNLLNNTTLTGNIQNAEVTIEENSFWVVSSNSTLTVINDPEGISGNSVLNITGNGNNVYYDKNLSGNSYLNGQIYYLVNGGILAPVGTTSTAEQKELPGKFILYHNYPNPFNPSTIIGFDIPEESHVLLKIYNMLGQEVRVLIDNNLKAGHYEFRFDAENITAGIYFYQLTSGSYSCTRKLVIQK